MAIAITIASTGVTLVSNNPNDKNVNREKMLLALRSAAATAAQRVIYPEKSRVPLKAISAAINGVAIPSRQFAR